MNMINKKIFLNEIEKERKREEIKRERDTIAALHSIILHIIL